MSTTDLKTTRWDFWGGVLFIATIIVFLVAALAGVHPNKDGSIPIICNILSWLLHGVVWIWSMISLVAYHEDIKELTARWIVNKNIIGHYELAAKVAVFIYIIILILSTAILLNPFTRNFVANAIIIR